MSNSRNNTKPETQPGHSRQTSIPIIPAPKLTGMIAIHWPTTSSMTIHDGSWSPVRVSASVALRPAKNTTTLSASSSQKPPISWMT